MGQVLKWTAALMPGALGLLRRFSMAATSKLLARSTSEGASHVQQHQALLVLSHQLLLVIWTLRTVL
jgi:hypothetical protein